MKMEGLLAAGAPVQPHAVGVIVMPFEIHAPAELAYFKSELPAAMKQQFAEEGANARVLDDATAGMTGATGTAGLVTSTTTPVATIVTGSKSLSGS